MNFAAMEKAFTEMKALENEKESLEKTKNELEMKRASLIEAYRQAEKNTKNLQKLIATLDSDLLNAAKNGNYDELPRIKERLLEIEKQINANDQIMLDSNEILSSFSKQVKEITQKIKKLRPLNDSQNEQYLLYLALEKNSSLKEEFIANSRWEAILNSVWNANVEFLYYVPLKEDSTLRIKEIVVSDQESRLFVRPFLHRYRLNGAHDDRFMIFLEFETQGKEETNAKLFEKIVQLENCKITKVNGKKAIVSLKIPAGNYGTFWISVENTIQVTAHFEDFLGIKGFSKKNLQSPTPLFEQVLYLGHDPECS